MIIEEDAFTGKQGVFNVSIVGPVTNPCKDRDRCACDEFTAP